MGPSCEHELEIARIVDQISIEGRLYPSSNLEVDAAMKFLLSPDDTQFLARYIQWRMENPITK